MERFAKIVETGDAQVLFFIEHDADSDRTQLHQMTVVDGAQADMAIGFGGENQFEHAVDMLRKADEEYASDVVREIRRVLA